MSVSLVLRVTSACVTSQRGSDLFQRADDAVRVARAPDADADAVAQARRIEVADEDALAGGAGPAPRGRGTPRPRRGCSCPRTGTAGAAAAPSSVPAMRSRSSTISRTRSRSVALSSSEARIACSAATLRLYGTLTFQTVSTSDRRDDGVAGAQPGQARPLAERARDDEVPVLAMRSTAVSPANSAYASSTTTATGCSRMRSSCSRGRGLPVGLFGEARKRSFAPERSAVFQRRQVQREVFVARDRRPVRAL